VDIGLDITFLLADPTWKKVIDPEKIGVAGFSQGGFTALWVGGAKVNRERYLDFQRSWQRNALLPSSVRDKMPIDPSPALDVADKRVKAVFAMAPGIIQVFGFDEAGLRELRVPTYIVVGQGDTVTPAKENAQYAASHIPGAKLNVLPGPVQHYDFMNECEDETKGEFIEVCFDAPGVDRAKIHELVGKEAVAFLDASLGVAR